MRPRRVVYKFGAVLLLASAVVWFYRDEPPVRRAAFRGVGLLYSALDVFSSSPTLDFGPALNDEDAFLDDRRIESRLKAWFPRSDVAFQHAMLRNPRPSDIFFHHEDLRHERVARFRQEAGAVLDGTPDLFELCQRIRSLSPHGDSLMHAGTDPIQYLRWAKSGHTMLCQEFAVLYGAACVTEGYTTRLLGLSRDGSHWDHGVTEVYAPEYGKWLLIDPDFNLAYRRGSVWLNGHELHDAWESLKRAINATGLAGTELRDQVLRHKPSIASMTDVEMVVLGTAGEPLRNKNLAQGSSTGMNLEYFEYVFYATRNNYLSRSYPPGHPYGSTQYVLQSAEKGSPPEVCPEAYIPKSFRMLYWPVGDVTLRVAADQLGNEPALRIQAFTWTPNFDTFEFRTDKGPWTVAPYGTITWKVHQGENRLEVRSANLGGLRGRTAWMTIDIEPFQSDGTSFLIRANDSIHVRCRLHDGIRSVLAGESYLDTAHQLLCAS